jgi:hypothetical protein
MAERATYIMPTAGLCCGTDLIANVSQVPELTAFSKFKQQAYLLFVFDQMAQSTDRSERNNNCAFCEDQLVTFDFEECFTLDGRLVEDRNAKPWELSKLGLAKYHLFYKSLRDMKPTPRSIKLALKKLAGVPISALVDKLPVNWQAEVAEAANHLEAILSHRAEFIDELSKCV